MSIKKEAFSYLVFVGYSRRWSKAIAIHYKEYIIKLIQNFERKLSTQFDNIKLKPIFWSDNEISKLSRDEIVGIISDSSYAIIDITDFDDELAFLTGVVTSQKVPKLFLVSEAEKNKLKEKQLFEFKPIEYKSIEDLQSSFSFIFEDLKKLIENPPVPSHLIYSLWFPRDVKFIWIVCPQIEDPGEFADRSSPDYTYLDNLGDTDSLLEIMVFLSRYYPLASIEKFSSRDLPIGLTKGNLVVIGGPGSSGTINNHLAKSMMESIDSRVTYSKDCESMFVNVNADSTIELKAKFESNSKEVTSETSNLLIDYGYFARFPNPANETNQVVCINGIHTSGVLGAVHAFGDKNEASRNYQTLFNNYGNISKFESFFEVNVVNGTVIVPKLEVNNIFLDNKLVEDKSVESTLILTTKKQFVKVNKKASNSEGMAKHTNGSLAQVDSRLKLVNVLARQIKKSDSGLFENTSGIFLLHVLPDLIPFMQAFELIGLNPSNSIIYFKRYPYSQKEQTLQYLKDSGYNIETMENMNKSLPELLNAINRKNKIFILEDGGYVGPLLHKLRIKNWDRILGAVEQTERGARMYEKIKNLHIPVAPVARSEIKNRQEPPHIGRTIVANIQNLLKNQNLAGKRCLVIGYGRIGEAVCEAARGIGMNVSVYDRDKGILAKAAQSSYNTNENLNQLLAEAQIIIGTTGNESLGRENILSLKHGAVLVSGSSGQYEIGIDSLEILSRKKQTLSIGTEYILEKESRKILLLGDGYPINFVGVESIPDEAIDPVMAALFAATVAMVKETPESPGLKIDWTNKVIKHYELEQLFFDMYFK